MVSLYKLKGAEEYERRLKIWKPKVCFESEKSIVALFLP